MTILNTLFNAERKTVAMITAGFRKMVDELRLVEEATAAEIAHIETKISDLTATSFLHQQEQAAAAAVRAKIEAIIGA